MRSYLEFHITFAYPMSAIASKLRTYACTCVRTNGELKVSESESVRT